MSYKQTALILFILPLFRLGSGAAGTAAASGPAGGGSTELLPGRSAAEQFAQGRPAAGKPRTAFVSQLAKLIEEEYNALAFSFDVAASQLLQPKRKHDFLTKFSEVRPDAAANSRFLSSVETDSPLRTPPVGFDVTAPKAVPTDTTTTIASRLSFGPYFAVVALTSIAACSLISMMMGHPSETSLRIPPRWGPEMENTYTFHNYAQDVLDWCLQTDVPPHCQCACIAGKLSGTARELARTMSPNEKMYGGQIDGQDVDPVTLLLYALQVRFASLGEETRLQAFT